MPYFLRASGWPMIVGIVLGLIGTVALYFVFLPESKREQFKDSKVLLFLHDLLNFKTLVIEKILKFLYIFMTIVMIVAGFFFLFVRGAFTSGLVMMIVGPIVLRLVYEILLLVIIGVNNICEINKKIPAKCGKKKSEEPVEKPEEKPLEKPFDNTEI